MKKEFIEKFGNLEQLKAVIYVVLYLAVVKNAKYFLEGASAGDFRGKYFFLIVYLGLFGMTMCFFVELLKESRPSVEEKKKFYKEGIRKMLLIGFLAWILRKGNGVTAHLVTAMIFGLFHVGLGTIVENGIIEMVAIFPTFFLGLGYSIVYEKTKSIRFSIALHMIMNVIASVIFLANQ